MPRIYIISGTRDEYEQYCEDNPSITRDKWYVHVTHAETIIDDNPSGIFIGTWMANPEIKGILNKLYSAVYKDSSKRRIIESVSQMYDNAKNII